MAAFKFSLLFTDGSYIERKMYISYISKIQTEFEYLIKASLGDVLAILYLYIYIAFYFGSAYQESLIHNVSSIT